MAIHRRFLYAGLFLVALGGVMVAADLAAVDGAAVRQGLRLWPLAIIAIAVAIIVRRTRVSLPAGILAAVAPGLLLGGSFAAGPSVAYECNATDAPPVTFHQAGNLFGTPFVAIRTGCGTSTITTTPGTAWNVNAGSSDGVDPNVSAGSDALTIESSGRGGRQLMFGDRREVWDVSLPSRIELLQVTANANDMSLGLPDSRIGSLALDANASNVRIDAAGSELNELNVNANFSSVSVLLPQLAARVEGSFDVNAGSLKLCQPPDSGMTVQFSDDGLHEVSVAGVRWSSSRWTGGNVLSSHQIDLTVDTTLGSVEINPIGGC
jgi:hypothetical protein